MKSLFFAVVVLLCIQTLYADDGSSSNCISDRFTLRRNAKSYFRKFNNQHQKGRDIANNKVFPICRKLYTARALFRSSQYDDNEVGLLKAVNDFIAPVSQVSDELRGYLKQLADEVEALVKLYEEFTSSYPIDCVAASDEASPCEKDRSNLECTINGFNALVPDLAQITFGLLDEINKGIDELEKLVEDFQDTENPTLDDINAFLKEYGTKHDNTHGAFEMFRSICDLVDTTLKTVISPALGGF